MYWAYTAGVCGSGRSRGWEGREKKGVEQGGGQKQQTNSNIYDNNFLNAMPVAAQSRPAAAHPLPPFPLPSSGASLQVI